MTHRERAEQALRGLKELRDYDHQRSVDELTNLFEMVESEAVERVVDLLRNEMVSLVRDKSVLAKEES